jgi:hypothetical protein
MRPGRRSSPRCPRQRAGVGGRGAAGRRRTPHASRTSPHHATNTRRVRARCASRTPRRALARACVHRVHARVCAPRVHQRPKIRACISAQRSASGAPHRAGPSRGGAYRARGHAPSARALGGARRRGAEGAEARSRRAPSPERKAAAARAARVSRSSRRRWAPHDAQRRGRDKNCDQRTKKPRAGGCGGHLAPASRRPSPSPAAYPSRTPSTWPLLFQPLYVQIGRLSAPPRTNRTPFSPAPYKLDADAAARRVGRRMRREGRQKASGGIGGAQTATPRRMRAPLAPAARPQQPRRQPRGGKPEVWGGGAAQRPPPPLPGFGFGLRSSLCTHPGQQLRVVPEDALPARKELERPCARLPAPRRSAQGRLQGTPQGLLRT